MNNTILELLELNPVIAAIRDEGGVEKAIKSKVEVVFILSGNLLNIREIVEILKRYKKKVLIHIDLIDGLGKDRAAIDFLKKYIQPDGCITTKVALAKYAKQQGLFTILRLFIIDSHSLVTGIKSINETKLDAIEVMPGIASKLIHRLKEQVHIPVIAGGLIETKEDIIESLAAGVLAVSTSREELWDM
jgi:glycerol uptake operon antiterminator